MATAVVDFEKDKSYKLKGSMLIQNKNGQWMPRGSELLIVRNNEDKTLLAKLPSGELVTCASFMLELPEPEKKEHADFADFNSRVAGDKEEKTIIPEGKEVLIGGKKFIERDVPLLFQTGDYPDKEFNMTPEEGKETYEDFLKEVKEVSVPISHKSTILDAHNDSKFYGLEYKVGKDKEGKDVGRFSGKIRLEPYLDSFLKKEKTWGVSARFINKVGEKKRLVHVALVPNPRVEEARIVAGSNFEKELVEFAAKEIPTMSGYGGVGTGTGTTEKTNADLPPIPAEDSKTTDILPKESPTGEELQEAENGGKGSTDTDSDLEEMGDYDEPQGQELWDMIGELVEKAMKDCPEGAPKLLQILSQGKAAEGGAATPPTTNPTDNPVPAKAPNAGPDANFSKEKEELAKEREALDKQKAQFEVDFAITEFRITPAEQEVILNQLVRAAKDDRTVGTADFATGDGRFTQSVKALRARPVSQLKGTNFSGGTLLTSTVNKDQKEGEAFQQKLSKLAENDPILKRGMEYNRNGHSKN